jgi:O-antigen/teichoic acid export membrane protein
MPLSTSSGTEWRTWLLRRIEKLRSRILLNAGTMLCGRGFQLVGRIAYFVMVAHLLGPAAYGTYVACTALCTAISPFAVLGTADVMTKYAARDRSTSGMYFGNALVVTVMSGFLLTLLALLLRPKILPASATSSMLIVIAIAEFLGTQLTAICAQAFLALEQAANYALVLSLTTTLRVVAAVALQFTSRTAMSWACLYAMAGVLATLTGIVMVSRRCARPGLEWKRLPGSVREGIHFATASASQFVYDDIDKVMLARLSSVEAAAVYAVAYRFVEGSMLPIYSLASATYPEFFRRGMRGVTSAFGFARSIIRRSVLYGITVTLVLLAAAQWVPLIMGQSYAESTIALRYLALLPLLKSVHAFLTDTLTGANYQWERSSAQIFVAVFNILINLWLIRWFAFRGAAWSSLITDFLLMAVLYLIIRWHLRRERSSASVGAEPVLVAGREQ